MLKMRRQFHRWSQSLAQSTFVINFRIFFQLSQYTGFCRYSVCWAIELKLSLYCYSKFINFSVLEEKNSKSHKGLQDYHMLKRRYDQEGINLRQAQLLKSFWHQCKFINYFEINKLILSLSHSINSILIIYWLKYFNISD